LPLQFDRQFSFENYFIEDSATSLLFACLRCQAENRGEALVGIWGGTDSGKTHLINAVSGHAREIDQSLFLYNGDDLKHIAPEQLGELPPGQMIAIDNIDELCGIMAWERYLYQLINLCRDNKHRFLFSSRTRPANLICLLDDLKSRLSWGLLFQLPIASDESLGWIIQFRAQLLGLTLSDDVVRYLLTRYRRQLGFQLELLSKLDRASLAYQRRITIPMIKQVLSDEGRL
jgi:DnaA-homolog protein